MTIAAIVVLVVAAVAALQSALGTWIVGSLGDDPPASSDVLPRVSIIIAARNEEEHVERALGSVLAQDYPHLDIVFVDDRSDDATARFAEAKAAEDGRLRVLHVTELPEGWLGKNHALHAGAEAATGEWLLFTDADVIFEAHAVRAGLDAVLARRLDMLACSPRVSSPSAAVRTFVAGFAMFFGLYVRPWQIRNPKRKASAGIGAYNLVRATAYRRAGGHTRLRLRPDDDLMLGRAVKHAGGRTDLMFGGRFVSVDWYPSLGALVEGLMKNAFAGVNYSVPAVVASVAGMLTVGVAPFVLAVTLTGPLQLAAVVVSAVLLAVAFAGTRAAGLPFLHGLGLPVSSALFCYIIVRAAVRTLRQGGIVWRGTFYPLDELRRNRRV